MQRGTFDYMAPELFLSYTENPDNPEPRHDVTLAVDIYSFGLVMREVITGKKSSRRRNSSERELR